MRKYLILALLFTVLSVLNSCQMEEMTLEKGTVQGSEMVVYHVGIDNGDEDTRTSLGPAGASGISPILWSEGDKMNIFFGVNNDNKDKLTLMEGAGTVNGSFYGPYIAFNDETMDKVHQTVIVYPFNENNTCVSNESKTEYIIGLTIPSVQNYAASSFANGSYPMVGVTENPKAVVIKTMNVNSGVRLKLKGNKSIERIVLSSEEPLAGQVSVVASYGKEPIATAVESAASKTVELLCDGVQLSNDVATDFIISFIPGEKSISVTIYDTEGGYMQKTVKSTWRRSKINSGEYEYIPENSILKDLKAAFKNGGEYKLPMDVTVPEGLVITQGKTLNLDLNGYTLTSTAKLSGSNGCIQTTGSELNISNGKIVGNAGYLFVTNGYNEKLKLELSNVDIVAKGTSVFYFADGTDIVLNDVTLDAKGKGFYSQNNAPKGSILINVGKYKATDKVFDLESALPAVIFEGECLFSDKSYAGAQWTESGDDTYPWKPVAYTIFVGARGFYNIDDAVKSIKENVAATVKLSAGEYTMPYFANKNITFEPLTDSDVVIIKCNKASHIDTHYAGSFLNFNNVTLVGTKYATDTQGFQKAVEENYTKCTFEAYHMFAGDDVTVTECTFNGIEGQYFWTGSASDLTFNSCVFNGVDRAVKVVGVGNAQDTPRNVIFNNCAFNATVSNKAVLEFDSPNATSNYKVVLDDCTKSDLFPGWFADKGTGKYLVIIDGAYYAYDSESLKNSLKDMASGTIVLAEGEYALPNELNLTTGSPRKDITIKGAGIGKTNINGSSANAGSPGNYAHNVDLRMENLTFTTANNGYNGGFGHAAGVEFANCKIIGQYYAHSGAPHKFTGCTIDPLNGYLYTYASDCEFDDCMFYASAGKALQVYEDDANGSNTVTIKNSSFKAIKQAATWDGKPVTGIDINSNGSTKFVVNIINCKTAGFPEGLNSQSKLWNVKNVNGDITVNVDGVTVWDANGLSISEGVGVKGDTYGISSKAGLEWLSSQVANGNNFTGKTVKLTSDINLNNVDWSPIGGSDSYANNFAGTFDGNGKIISNLKVTNTKCAGLFGTMTAGTIKNLTISGAKLTTNHYAGAIVAWMEKGAQPFTIDNCHVKNITILVTPDGQPGAYDNGDKAGAIAGFMHYGSITNCTVENANITAYRDLGGVVGYVKGTTVTNNNVKNTTLTIDQLTNYYGDEAVNVGQIIGRRAGNPTESGNTYSNVIIETRTQQNGNFNKPVVGGDF